VRAIDLSSAKWRRSSYSNTTGGECVEVAALQAQVAVRDSKIPDGNTLTVSTGAFVAFVEGVTRSRRGSSPS
jgi:hypothetical protein